ncbi:hypothetical protein PINS_up024524 [Pythium insidiosum]|nr:hypothetical protein PINS_up007078 [Pythium insidiosum]GLE11824.1 hypothetical protein PINS_up024524 [Pythium insidiosum]
MLHVSEDSMHEAERLICLPLVLLVNFSLFQYLVTVYYKRRKEIRVQMIFLTATMGFAVLIPLAHHDEELVGHLNSISETCSLLTFLLQIDIIGRDIARKVKLRFLRVLTVVAELLILFGLFVVGMYLIKLVAPSVNTDPYEWTANVMENTSLFFVFFFRFYYLAISRGLLWLWRERKLEVTFYLLFITHEYPFLALEKASGGVSWEPVQAVWHRVTLMLCILMTIREKFRSSKVSKDANATTTGFQSRGPSRKDKESSIYNYHPTTGPAKKAKVALPRPVQSASTTQASSRLSAGLSSLRQLTIRGGGLRSVRVGDHSGS